MPIAISKTLRRRFSYIVEQIAIILFSFAIGSLLFPRLQDIFANAFKQGLWKAVMNELNSAWPSLLVTLALIVAAIALLLRHGDNDELKDDIKEIKRLLNKISDEVSRSKD